MFDIALRGRVYERSVDLDKIETYYILGEFNSVVYAYKTVKSREFDAKIRFLGVVVFQQKDLVSLKFVNVIDRGTLSRMFYDYDYEMSDVGKLYSEGFLEDELGELARTRCEVGAIYRNVGGQTWKVLFTLNGNSAYYLEVKELPIGEIKSEVWVVQEYANWGLGDCVGTISLTQLAKLVNVIPNANHRLLIGSLIAKQFVADGTSNDSAIWVDEDNSYVRYKGDWCKVSNFGILTYVSRKQDAATKLNTLLYMGDFEKVEAPDLDSLVRTEYCIDQSFIPDSNTDMKDINLAVLLSKLMW